LTHRGRRKAFRPRPGAPPSIVPMRE
jgi:hypothetical protein